MKYMKRQWKKLVISSLVFYYIFPILFSVVYVVIKLSFFCFKKEDHFIILLPLFMIYYSLYNVIYYIIFNYIKYVNNECNKKWFIINECFFFLIMPFFYGNIIKRHEQLYFEVSFFILQLTVITIIMLAIVIAKNIFKRTKYGKDISN